MLKINNDSSITFSKPFEAAEKNGYAEVLTAHMVKNKPEDFYQIALTEFGLACLQVMFKNCLEFPALINVLKLTHQSLEIVVKNKGIFFSDVSEGIAFLNTLIGVVEGEQYMYKFDPIHCWDLPDRHLPGNLPNQNYAFIGGKEVSYSAACSSINSYERWTNKVYLGVGIWSKFCSVDRALGDNNDCK